MTVQILIFKCMCVCVCNLSTSPEIFRPMQMAQIYFLPQDEANIIWIQLS